MNITKWLPLNDKLEARIRELIERQQNKQATQDDSSEWALRIAYQAIDRALQGAAHGNDIESKASLNSSLYCPHCSEQLLWSDDEGQIYHNNNGFVEAISLHAMCPACGKAYTGNLDIHKFPKWSREGQRHAISQTKMEKGKSHLTHGHQTHWHRGDAYRERCQKWKKAKAHTSHHIKATANADSD